MRDLFVWTRRFVLFWCFCMRACPVNGNLTDIQHRLVFLLVSFPSLPSSSSPWSLFSSRDGLEQSVAANQKPMVGGGQWRCIYMVLSCMKQKQNYPEPQTKKKRHHVFFSYLLFLLSSTPFFVFAVAHFFTASCNSPR